MRPSDAANGYYYPSSFTSSINAWVSVAYNDNVDDTELT